MARCDVCGNDYDKAFQVTQQGRTMTFDSFEMRDSGDGADVRPLRLQGCRPRCRGRRQDLLLCSLCQAGGRQRAQRPRLAGPIPCRMTATGPIVGDLAFSRRNPLGQTSAPS